MSMVSPSFSSRRAGCAPVPRQIPRAVRTWALAAPLLGVAAWLPATPALAATVGSGTPASCTQAALQTAINGGGTVDFNCGGAATILVTSPVQVPDTATLIIDGNDLITLDGNGSTYIMAVNGGPLPPLVTLRNLIFTQGNINTGLNAGGAIQNTGNLVVENVSFISNTATGAGGAIFSQPCIGCADSQLSVINSLFQNNVAGSGGAVSVQGGTVSIVDSRFDGNQAQSGGALQLFTNVSYTVQADIRNTTFSANGANPGGAGGGVSVYLYNLGSQATFTNVTFAGNTVAAGVGYNQGGALEVSAGPVVLNNVTLANNSALSGGGLSVGGSYPDRTTVTLHNALLANNAGGNCASALGLSGDHNLQYGDGSCSTGGFATGNPVLGALADNGGPNGTMALGSGSLAIDAGNPAFCPVTDQRGVARADGDSNGSVVCDIGAFEAAQGTTAAPLPVPVLGPLAWLALAGLVMGVGGLGRRRGWR